MQKHDIRNICCTYSATRATKFTHALKLWEVKTKKKKNQPVTFRKTVSARRLSRVRSGLMVCREERKQSVVKPIFLLLTDATDASFLPSFCAFYQFSSFQDWNVYMVHYTLETIRDSLTMNEEDHLNHLVRRWSVTDHTFIQFYGWEWKTVIT